MFTISAFNLDQKSLLGFLLAKKWSEKSQSHFICIGKLTFERIQRKKLHNRTDVMLLKTGKKQLLRSL